VPPLPPQVALTVNVPAVQAGFPPGTETALKLPSAELGKVSIMSAMLPTAFLTMTITAVFASGRGETEPVTVMGWEPEYELASV